MSAGAGDECGIDYILEAQKKGEISEGNVLYLIENINVAGPNPNLNQFNGRDLVIVIDCSGRNYSTS